MLGDAVGRTGRFLDSLNVCGSLGFGTAESNGFDVRDRLAAESPRFSWEYCGVRARSKLVPELRSTYRESTGVLQVRADLLPDGLYGATPSWV